MAKPFILFILLLIGLQGQAQHGRTAIPSTEVSAPAIPFSQTKTTDGIAHYLNSKYKTPQQKVTAIYYWLAKNVAYDVQGLSKTPVYFEKQALIAQTLSSRKAVCQGYAELFHELCAKTGVPSYVITGLATSSGVTTTVAHAWNAAFVDGQWYLFDPTWGAGFVERGVFVPRTNDKYFMVSPAAFIKNHKPFDFLWQFLPQPVAYNGQPLYNSSLPTSKKTFAFKDSIAAYEASSPKEKLTGAIRRMEAQKEINALVLFQLNHYKKELSALEQNETISEFNTAVSLYNQAIEQINSFINYQNRQFQPKKSDADLRNLAKASQDKLFASQKILSAIRVQHHPTMLISFQELNQKLKKALIQVNEQQRFVERYLKTPVSQRTTLFYRQAVADH